MEQIETIWELTKDWEGHWAQWKSGTDGSVLYNQPISGPFCKCRNSLTIQKISGHAEGVDVRILCPCFGCLILPFSKVP